MQIDQKPIVTSSSSNIAVMRDSRVRLWLETDSYGPSRPLEFKLSHFYTKLQIWPTNFPCDPFLMRDSYVAMRPWLEIGEKYLSISCCSVL